MRKYLLKVLAGFLIIGCFASLVFASDNFVPRENKILRRVRGGEPDSLQARDTQRVREAIASREKPLKLIVFDFRGTLTDEQRNVPKIIIDYLAKILNNKKHIAIITYDLWDVVYESLLKFLPKSEYLHVETRAHMVSFGGKAAALRAIMSALGIGPGNVMIAANQYNFWDRGFLKFPAALKFNVGEKNYPGVISLQTKAAAGSAIILSVYYSHISAK